MSDEANDVQVARAIEALSREMEIENQLKSAVINKLKEINERLGASWHNGDPEVEFNAIERDAELRSIVKDLASVVLAILSGRV